MEVPRLALACLRELRLELDACLNLLRDDSRREGVDKHEASATEPSPIRPLRAQGPTGADGSDRADEAIATGERAAGGDARRRRSDGGGAMKITPDHLARGAFIYIRQSTVDQLANNHESRLRQYGLADRARALGWTDVTVIDDDLGRSGSGVSRPGFERLLAAICEGRVGAVFAIEASRLARNGRDWHTLIEFCGLVGTVIVDEDGTYEPRHPNDRLLLGMKGTMSELELSLLRARGSFRSTRR